MKLYGSYKINRFCSVICFIAMPDMPLFSSPIYPPLRSLSGGAGLVGCLAAAQIFWGLLPNFVL
jgi:hypothetical protein